MVRSSCSVSSRTHYSLELLYFGKPPVQHAIFSVFNGNHPTFPVEMPKDSGDVDLESDIRPSRRLQQQFASGGSVSCAFMNQLLSPGLKGPPEKNHRCGSSRVVCLCPSRTRKRLQIIYTL